MRPARFALPAALAAVLLVAPPTAAAERFVKVFTGIGLTADSDLRIRRPDRALDLVFEGIEWEDHSLGGPSIPYLGARGGLYLERRPWLGFAIDIFHFKVFAETDRTVRVRGTVELVPVDGTFPLDAFVQRYNIGNGVNMVLATGLGRLRLRRTARFPEGRVQPYFGVGLGPTVLYTASTFFGDGRQGYELGGLGGQALAGVDLRLAQRVGVFAEVKLTLTEANGSIAFGASQTDLETRHLVVGAGYHF